MGDRYDECVICNEKYWDADIGNYMKEIEESGDMACKGHCSDLIEEENG